MIQMHFVPLAWVKQAAWFKTPTIVRSYKTTLERRFIEDRRLIQRRAA